MVGYSRLIGLDDLQTLERLRKLRSEVIDPPSTGMAVELFGPAATAC